MSENQGLSDVFRGVWKWKIEFEWFKQAFVEEGFAISPLLLIVNCAL